MGCSKHSYESTSDFEMFKINKLYYSESRASTTKDTELIDIGKPQVQQSTSWTILLEKGYICASLVVWALLPAKNSPNGRFTVP